MMYEGELDIRTCAEQEDKGMWWSVGVFFFQAEEGIRDHCVTGVQTCALPICVCVCGVYACVCVCAAVARWWSY